ncbi:hypothetical protein [Sphingomonas sp. dw_22]|uniref:hypothetical protein n=1 Tax=Sphingomonas sp. dw_22 TaxID=2721175 RepID=UPI001BD29246|nr:hypothetical protein [Sphingomonas sp. dw_22]
MPGIRDQATSTRRTGISWSDLNRRARLCGLDLGGWNSDYEGARIFLGALGTDRERSMIFEAGECA